METVTITFERKIMYSQYSLEAIIDDEITATVANGFSCDVNLDSEYGDFASIDSVEIKSVTNSYDGSMKVDFEVKGTYEGTGLLGLRIKCYDKNNYLLGTEVSALSLTSGENFKASKFVYVQKAPYVSNLKRTNIFIN